MTQELLEELEEVELFFRFLLLSWLATSSSTYYSRLKSADCLLLCYADCLESAFLSLSFIPFLLLTFLFVIVMVVGTLFVVVLSLFLLRLFAHFVVVVSIIHVITTYSSRDSFSVFSKCIRRLVFVILLVSLVLILFRRRTRAFFDS